MQASDARFINASVEFDLATLKPTYRLLWGQGGLSNALAVAEGLGFDPLVIQRAREIATRGQVCDARGSCAVFPLLAVPSVLRSFALQVVVPLQSPASNPINSACEKGSQPPREPLGESTYCFSL